MNPEVRKDNKENSAFQIELKNRYLELIAQKAIIDAELSKMKQVAIQSAPNMVTERKTLKWDYQPGIHKLPTSYFKLDSAKVSSVYNSAAGGESFTSKYGLKCSESISYSWRSNLDKENKS